MKKVIAAAAGLMLVGTMVGTATAAVSLSGDARARWYYETNADGTTATDQDEKFSSRVRVKFNAEAKGGAYAKARLRMSDATWDGTSQTRDKGEGSNLYTDYAYIGVPMGPVTVEAGLMPVDLTKFAYWDRREDQVAIKWANDMTTLQFMYQKDAEYTNEDTDTVDDDDINTYVGVLSQKFAGDFGMTAVVFMTDDQTADDASGFSGTFHVGGPAGPLAFEAEVTYVEGDVQGTEDDGIGAYAQGAMDFGATSLALNVGLTKDGFAADDDFGFIMIGGASSITPSLTENVGGLGDTIWAGAVPGFKVSEALSLKGNLVYADVDDVATVYEVSGSMVYAISDGASLQWDVGYLAVDDDADALEDPFGTAVTLAVSF